MVALGRELAYSPEVHGLVYKGNESAHSLHKPDSPDPHTPDPPAIRMTNPCFPPVRFLDPHTPYPSAIHLTNLYFPLSTFS